jgi:hypothetical protein
MTHPGLLVCAAVVTAVNLGLALLVASDRNGPPDTVAVLDERELRLETDRGDDNNAVRLAWRVQPAAPSRAASEPGLAVGIGPRALEALGFDVSIRPGDPAAAAFYRAVPARPAFIVFDLAEGAVAPRVAAWQERARAATDVETVDEATIAAAPMLASRLVPVDAGPDAEALRARYADTSRYLVLPGVVRLRLVDVAGRAGGPVLVGEIAIVSPERLLVPHTGRRVFERLPEVQARGQGPARAGDVTLVRTSWPPRYRVEVIVGRRYLPRVGRVELLVAPAP